MKIVSFAPPLVCLLLLSYSAPAAPSSPAQSAQDLKRGYSVKIHLARDNVKTGTPVPVEVTVNNQTKEALLLDRGSPVQFDVRDSNDNQPLSRRGEQILRGAPRKPGEANDLPTGGGPPIWVKAGGTETLSRNVPDLFDLGKPGIYKIQVYLANPGGQGGRVRSNKVKVTITP